MLLHCKELLTKDSIRLKADWVTGVGFLIPEITEGLLENRGSSFYTNILCQFSCGRNYKIDYNVYIEDQSIITNSAWLG